MENEIWKVHHITNKGHKNERVYEVSNKGRVRINGLIQQLNDKHVYYRCGCRLVHRMVAECFIPNPENKPYIDHIDTNKHNNNVDNLRWVTHKENMNNLLTKQNTKRIAIESNARPEVRAKQRERRLSWWQTATDEQKAIRNKNVSEALKNLHNH